MWSNLFFRQFWFNVIDFSVQLLKSYIGFTQLEYKIKGALQSMVVVQKWYFRSLILQFLPLCTIFWATRLINFFNCECFYWFCKKARFFAPQPEKWCCKFVTCFCSYYLVRLENIVKPNLMIIIIITYPDKYSNTWCIHSFRFMLWYQSPNFVIFFGMFRVCSLLISLFALEEPYPGYFCITPRNGIIH